MVDPVSSISSIVDAVFWGPASISSSMVDAVFWGPACSSSSMVDAVFKLKKVSCLEFGHTLTENNIVTDNHSLN